jgi:hypothetical protein
MVNRQVAKPSRKRRVGDGSGSHALVRSSRGEIRHPRFSLTAPLSDTPAMRRAIPQRRPHSQRATAAGTGLARLGTELGRTQGTRLRIASQGRNRDLRRHDRSTRITGPGQTDGLRARTRDSAFAVRTHTSSVHRRGRHQRYLITQGRRFGGFARSLSSAFGTRDSLVRTLSRTDR